MNPNTGDKVSLLGYGMMRLPQVGGGCDKENDAPIDQDMVNRQIKYALEHGVNYFDTSPLYCQGHSEHSTGIALHRFPRKKYFIATKMSNMHQFSRQFSINMFNNSLKELQTTYLDYYLLHCIGTMDERNDAMAVFNDRFIKNGILNFILQKKKEGVIRNLGFSYHGDVKVFDYALQLHDEGKLFWDFVQIEMNYLDWDFANEINDFNTDAKYLYGELLKRNIPVVVMEPLLGGRLSNLPQPIVVELKKRDPIHSAASWAFRYAASFSNVLTLLSGMTYMEHLKDNLRTLSPLKPLTEAEKTYLEKDVAQQIMGFDTIPCNNCNYCMPCPYGVNIPAIFVHYNKCKNEGRIPGLANGNNYEKYRREFLIGYDRSVPKLRQANHCIGCGHCVPNCPQHILIPMELQKIDKFVEQLKQN